jgi:hypothetical protein
MEQKAGRVVKIDFFTYGSMPQTLREIAQKSGKSLTEEDGIIAVKTIISSPPRYEFEMVGKGKGIFTNYVNKIAESEGANMAEAVERALGESSESV